MENKIVFLVTVRFYRGDGINLKTWDEIKGIYSSRTNAVNFIKENEKRYDRVDFIINEIELDNEIKNL